MMLSVVLVFITLATCLQDVVSAASSNSGSDPAASSAKIRPTPSTDNSTGFIPCSDPCNGGDVNYELTASIRTMKLLNYTYRGRTYSRDGDPTFMGPTMHVQPGQSIWIKLVNNMSSSSSSSSSEQPEQQLGPHEPTVEDYWRMVQNPGEHIKYQYYKPAVASPDQMKVDWPNMPHAFDSTNLHLHGLDIAVHMFDPVGTHNPDAPHIVIEPHDCYCYQFDVPHHHPTGLYWYHPHLHGSSALQIWSGMLGLLYVDEQMLPRELQRYGVTRTHEFVIWDPAFRSVDGTADGHNLEVDEFLMGQTTLSKIHPFLVNGVMTPNFDISTGEVLHLRTLCATIENENTFIVYREGEEGRPWDEAALPFWIVASDGVTYEKPVRKTIVVLAGGQREEILLQLDEPGRYVISQQGIEGYQFFGMMGHPHSQILATITVTSDNNAKLPNTPIPDMRFTPGYTAEQDIRAEDIDASETIVFSMGADRDTAPMPQYYVNGKSFDPNRIDWYAHPGESREYILINANHNVHPFHIHVNRFQVKEMGSELSARDYPVLTAVLDHDDKLWRDTVVVPPNGRTRIWVRYGNYTGKTLFHCHFLAHEDTGMMSTLFIGEPEITLLHWMGDHAELLLGVGAGMMVATALALALVVVRSKKSREEYGAVPMNELKSKAQD